MSKRVAWLASLACFAALSLAACGGGGDDDTTTPPPSPYDGIPATQTIHGDGLSAPVEVVRDIRGVPHIYAHSEADVAFANGYVMASDRIAQMNLFRHAAAGNISKLFGALEPAQIDDDIRMRIHRMRPIAHEAWLEMSSSTDPTDQKMAAYLSRYCDGVNAYVEDLKAGKYTQDPAIEVFFPPDLWEPWTPEDSLSIGRLQAYSLSFDDFDLAITRTIQRAETAFPANSPDAQLARRALTGFDLTMVHPMATVAPLDGFPNVDHDSGGHAKPSAAAPAATSARPWLEPGLLDKAVANARPVRLAGFDSAHAFMASNNWVVGPQVAGGTTLLANDTHLPLINPSIWYLVHLTVPGQLDAEGIAFPGLPSVQLGHNEHIAWGATVMIHDVYDYYAEDIEPCTAGGGDCVLFQGNQVAIEPWTETIDVGANGTVIRQVQVTYENVPHHGPILPDVVNGQVVPRTGHQAISVKFTGHQVTHEGRALYRMMHASTVQDGMDALDDYNYGAMNWVLADDQGHIGYTGSARVPRRSAGCFTFDATTPSGRQGVAPYMVVPGDGSCEWTGLMLDRYLPYAIDPPLGYLGTANADPIGATFDGNALNGPIVDGAPLYLGAIYDPGMRVERVYERLAAIVTRGTPATILDMQSIQADNHSNFGGRLRPFIAEAVAVAKAGDASSEPDAAAYYAALPPAKQARLDAAVERLNAWTLETPAAMEGTPSAEEISDASATVIFNAWGHFFYVDAYGDEAAALGTQIENNLLARPGLVLLEHPEQLLTGIDPTTHQPVLCDDLATAATIESCSFIIVRALDRALDFAETRFHSASMDDWRWGELHRLTLSSQLPDAQLDVPPPDESNPAWVGGYPRHGMTYSIDAADSGWTDLEFDYGFGPAIRHVTQFTPGQPPRSMFALPGGETFDRRSPHYRDLVDNYYYKNEYFELAWLTPSIIAQAESRWHFTP